MSLSSQFPPEAYIREEDKVQKRRTVEESNRKVPKRHARHYSPPPSSFEQPDMIEPDSPLVKIAPPISSWSAIAPSKGILKVSRVHFPEDLPECPEHTIVFPPRPPPPPPPSPPLTPGIRLRSEHTSMLPFPSPPPPPAPRQEPPPVAPPPAQAPRPPSLFDPQIESDRYLSGPAFELYTRFFRELSGFVEQQSEVIRIRLAVQERRMELRRLRDCVSRCDMELFNHVRKCATKEASFYDPEMGTLFGAAQAARDLVGPAEAEYEPMEVDLGAEEHKLEERYDSLQSHFEQFIGLNTNTTSVRSTPSKIQYEESSSSSNDTGVNEESVMEPRDVILFHGAWIGEQVAIGQAPMLAENTPTTSSSWSSRQIRQIQRPTVSSDAADNSKRLLSSNGPDDRPSTHSQTMFGSVETAVTSSRELGTRVKNSCCSLLGVASQFNSGSLDVTEPFPDIFPSDSEPQRTDFLRLLLQPPVAKAQLSEYMHDFKIMEGTLHDYLASFNDTQDRVNRWILHQLRLSRRETYSLRRLVIQCAPQISDWTSVALENWPNDHLGYEQSYNADSVEQDTTSSVSAAHHLISPALPHDNAERGDFQTSHFASNKALALNTNYSLQSENEHSMKSITDSRS